MRVVLDTNCLLVSFPKVSKSRWLFDMILNGIIELAVTADILQKYEEVTGDFYESPNLAKDVVKTLLNRPNPVQVSPYYFWFLIKDDPGYNKFVDCSVACGADYLITEDSHFTILKTIAFPRVHTRTWSEFREIMLPLQ